MNEKITDLISKIRLLEDTLEDEYEKNRRLYRLKLQGKFAEFAEDVIARHRELRVNWLRFIAHSDILNIVVAPVIYSAIIPIALVDLWLTIYQHVCFRVYGIPLVKRSTYIMMDRHHLAYLNVIEKINCIYCGYGNGVFAYAREIAGRTEQFWCPIKHAVRVRDPHRHYTKFLEHGDGEGYCAKLQDVRNDIRSLEE
ncbi:MAG: hypothetical protein EOM37_05040 [Proteobacteria bacterium]|jgi:hypothetical protein|nr:hypothetical protein [Alphaproteobacteria bacterium]NCC03398.1 hypothetical protein [Pseudomonadota bacterium]